MEITAIIVKSNGHAYLESLWSDPEKAQKELKRLQKRQARDSWFEDDEYTIETQAVHYK
jgi:hypothetical protein